MKTRYKKGLGLLLVFGLVFTILSACGKNTSNESASPSNKAAPPSTSPSAPLSETPAEKVTLKLVTVNGWWQPGHDEIVKAAEEKLGIKVEIEKLPDGQGDQVIRTKLATGELPDLVVYYGGANFKQISPEQYFLDLTSEPWVDNIVDSAKKTLTVDGKLYGAPIGTMTIGGMFYNKQIYKELNLSIPKTWAELIANSEKIKAAGKVPVYASFKDDWTAQMLTLSSWYYTEQKTPDAASLINTNKLKLKENAEFTGTFAKLNELVTKGYVNKDYLAATFDNAVKALSNGEAAMYPMLSGIIGLINQNYPGKINDIGAFAIPGDDANVNGVSVWANQGLYISKESKNVDAAKKFLAFFASKEGQEAYFNVQKIEGSPSYKNIVDVSSAPEAIKELIQYVTDGKAATVLENQIDIAISSDFPKIAIEAAIGQKTPLEAAQAVDAALAKNAKAKKLPGW